jgi:hypothetical protein
MSSAEFAKRRAYLRLTDNEYGKILDPIYKKFMIRARIYFFGFVVVIAAIYFNFFGTSFTFREVLESLLISAGSISILISILRLLGAHTCVAKYFRAATFRYFEMNCVAIVESNN